MFRSTSPILIGVVVLLELLGQAVAQEDKAPAPKKEGLQRFDEDYRNFFKKPETVQDYWDALKFEIDVGRFDLASRLLHGLNEKKPDDKDLLAIVNKEGMSAILRLRNIPRWSDDPKENAQARKDVEELINRSSAALKALLQDPERINHFIKNLNATPEERDYAVTQLDRSGATAVPYLVSALQDASPEQRTNLLYALARLGPDAVPPMLAALDINDAFLQTQLIDVVERRRDLLALHQRPETDPAPWWWPLTASPSESVRRKAGEALGLLFNMPPSRVMPARQGLTREAERYYRHQVHFADPGAVTIWRWDGKQLVAGWPGATTVSTSRAEEYYGLRFAREALAIDPTYEPAQVLFLSLALEKGMEKAGLDEPLDKAAPEVYQLLSTVNPELVNTVLERALTDQYLPVILGAIRALGRVAEVRALRPSGLGESALVRCLYYPDRRIQMAAVEALLRLPRYQEAETAARQGKQAPAASPARVVEVLRRMVAAEPGHNARPKVLLGFANEDQGQASSQVLDKVGFDPVLVRTGREVMRRLNEAADIDLVILDANLPDPGLSQLLGQLRSDVNSGLLPVLVLVPQDREENLRRVTERYRNVALGPPGLALDEAELKKLLPVLVKEAMGQPLDEAHLQGYAERSLVWLDRLARGEVPGYDVRPAAETVLNALHSTKLSQEAQLAAVDITGRLPGPKPQRELAGVVLDANRALPVRVAAATELVRHIQQHGPVLGLNEIRSLEALVSAGDTDAGLRDAVLLVLGSMHPDARVTGERLKGFQPPPPGAATAPAPAKEPKEEPKAPREEKEK